MLAFSRRIIPTLRILVVEDEEKVSRFTVRGLVAESFAVDVAAEGRAGLELATRAGLGLSIVRSIRAAHGGRIEVDSSDGKGGCSTVELPLANGQGKEPQSSI